MADPQVDPAAQEARPVSIKQMLNLAPEEAIAFLDAKGYRTSVDWTDTFEAEHTNAFTVAKIAKVDLLRTIHVSLLDAMAEGKPFEQWKQELQPELEKAGWWGKVGGASGALVTGTEDTVIIGPRRLRTIYDTNLRMARATALWGRVQAGKDAMPFLRYSAVLDRRTRPAHRAWHGTILPVDHPWWQTHFPPCGWNCRCTVVQMNQRMLDARELEVSAEPPPGGLVPFYRKATGETLLVPAGIDPGFAYNPGIARLKSLIEKATASINAAAQEGMEPVARAALRELVESPALEQFLAGSNSTGVPVAMLPAVDAAALQSSVRVVMLSERTAYKVLVERGRNYPVAVYRALQAAIDAPLMKVAQGADRILYVFRVDGDLYATVVRAEAAKAELWTATVFRTNPSDLGRLRRTGIVMIDQL